MQKIVQKLNSTCLGIPEKIKIATEFHESSFSAPGKSQYLMDWTVKLLSKKPSRELWVLVRKLLPFASITNFSVFLGFQDDIVQECFLMSNLEPTFDQISSLMLHLVNTRQHAFIEAIWGKFINICRRSNPKKVFVCCIDLKNLSRELYLDLLTEFVFNQLHLPEFVAVFNGGKGYPNKFLDLEFENVQDIFQVFLKQAKHILPRDWIAVGFKYFKRLASTSSLTVQVELVRLLVKFDCYRISNDDVSKSQSLFMREWYQTTFEENNCFLNASKALLAVEAEIVQDNLPKLFEFIFNNPNLGNELLIDVFTVYIKTAQLEDFFKEFFDFQKNKRFEFSRQLLKHFGSKVEGMLFTQALPCLQTLVEITGNLEIQPSPAVQLIITLIKHLDVRENQQERMNQLFESCHAAFISRPELYELHTFLVGHSFEYWEKYCNYESLKKIKKLGYPIQDLVCRHILQLSKTLENQAAMKKALSLLRKVHRPMLALEYIYCYEELIDDDWVIDELKHWIRELSRNNPLAPTGDSHSLLLDARFYESAKIQKHLLPVIIEFLSSNQGTFWTDLLNGKIDYDNLSKHTICAGFIFEWLATFPPAYFPPEYLALVVACDFCSDDSRLSKVCRLSTLKFLKNGIDTFLPFKILDHYTEKTAESEHSKAIFDSTREILEIITRKTIQNGNKKEQKKLFQQMWKLDNFGHVISFFKGFDQIKFKSDCKYIEESLKKYHAWIVDNEHCEYHEEFVTVYLNACGENSEYASSVIDWLKERNLYPFLILRWTKGQKDPDLYKEIWKYGNFQ